MSNTYLRVNDDMGSYVVNGTIFTINSAVLYYLSGIELV